MSGLAARYRDVAGRVGREVTLVAVSKKQPIEAIEELYRLGHRDFGENYVQELVEKARKLDEAGCAGIRWHFIGHLQTNKAKALVPHVFAVHSVDSERLGRELAKRWSDSTRAACGARLPCFVEVNLDTEPGKSGVAPADAPALAASLAALDALRLEGLMAIPSPGSGAEAFARLRALEERCRPHTRGRLSMGMSSDFELAIAQGSTHVRVGTSLFGARV